MLRLALLCCSFIIGFTACTANAKKNKNGEIRHGKSLLWRISGNGLDKPSYLLGTIHVICKDDYIWTDSMQKALDNTQKICFEMDMDDPSLQMKVATGLLINDGKTLEDYYTPEEYRRLSAHLQDSLGIPAMFVNKMKPVALSALLATRLVSCAMPESYEGNIMKLAQKQNKEIVGLETPEDQIAVFDKMNADSAASGLLDAIDHPDSMKVGFDKLLTAYKAQDLAAMYRLIIESPDMKGADLNDFLFNRNKNWIPGIAALIKKEPVFIAVGAGHLWGDEGVISLLRKAGYTVEPVQ